ncbi:hypothetical protein CDV36_000204 [Fusarium kuroshium]|uniref:Uncharacterized protein n=1 Tax=Fusarium kuroshium TaxID=2010991 RepID=A0A3M2SRV0_9HYPO|nr:hypothetical protein CDV36_000204 [Fusarium kuroshium]
MKQWLSRHKVTGRNEQLIVLRAQCLAAFVYVATILEPREMAFDVYAPEFQEIITAVETLSPNTVDGGTSSNREDDLPLFTPEMGIIHPLYFTALKYRDPFWRRRAVALLRRSGREGPWVGEIEAALASAIAAREEQPEKPGERVSGDLTRIPESARISNCWVVEYMRDDVDSGYISRSDETRIRKVKAILIRCYDMEKMLHNSIQAPNEHPWRDRTQWAWWEEIISVPYNTELEPCTHQRVMEPVLVEL